MIVGNDIASFQGNVNYDVYKNNSNFIICKASEGVNFKDPTLNRNQSEARRVGIPLGFYHFAKPSAGNTPEAEAQWFINSFWPIQQGEILVLDYEDGWGGDVVIWCKKFLDYIAAHVDGLKPLIYLNQSLLKQYNWKPVSDAGYGLWVAAYTLDPQKNSFFTGSWSFAAMQQWTDVQQVPGISGNVDGDVFFGTVASFMAYGYKKPTPPAPQPDPKDVLIKQLQGQVADLTGKLAAQVQQTGVLQDKLAKTKQSLITIINTL